MNLSILRSRAASGAALFFAITFFGLKSAYADGVFVRAVSIKDAMESQDDSSQMLAVGYVLGAFNGYISGLEDEQARRPAGKRTKPFCLPDGVVIEQIFAMTKIYFRNHPERWHLPADLLVIDAMREAWPCKTSGVK